MIADHGDVRGSSPLVAAALALLTFAPAAAADDIVVLRDADRAVATETAQRERALGFEAGRTYDRAIDGFTADLTAEQAAALRADPEVAAVVPDRPVHASGVVAVPDDARVPAGVHRVTLTAAGSVREAATGAVAVLDTGIDLEHPDLDAVAGTNCVEPGDAPDDENGHGTHVAGTIGARNNLFGVTGVAPGTRVIAVKVLDDEGAGTTSSVLCGIEWVLANAAAKDITVVNFSLGGTGPASTCENDPEHRAFCALAAAGITPVVAAGNAGRDFGDPLTRELPAAYPEVLTVTAIADTDGRPGGAGVRDRCTGQADDSASGFGNYATRARDAAHLVAAPGVCIRSTYAGVPYATMTGTSMAAPHVAGLVALCRGEGGAAGPCAGLSIPQVIARMRVEGPWSSATGIAGRIHGPVATLSDAAIPTPAVTGHSPEDVAKTTVATADQTAPAPRTAPASPGVVVLRPTPAVVPVRPQRARPAIRLVTPRLATLRRRGMAVRVTCPEACAGVLTLRVSRAVARRLRLRGTTLAVAYPTGAGTVRLRLTRAASTALRRAPATLRVQFAAELDLAERTVRSTKALTIRR